MIDLQSIGQSFCSFGSNAVTWNANIASYCWMQKNIACLDHRQVGEKTRWTRKKAVPQNQWKMYSTWESKNAVLIQHLITKNRKFAWFLEIRWLVLLSSNSSFSCSCRWWFGLMWLYFSWNNHHTHMKKIPFGKMLNEAIKFTLWRSIVCSVWLIRKASAKAFAPSGPIQFPRAQITKWPWQQQKIRLLYMLATL